MTRSRHRALRVSIRLAKLTEDRAAQELANALGELDRARESVARVRSAIDESDTLATHDEAFGGGLAYRTLLQRRLPLERAVERVQQDHAHRKMESFLEAHKARELYTRALDGKLTAERYERDKRETAAMLELSQMLTEQVRRRDAEH